MTWLKVRTTDLNCHRCFGDLIYMRPKRFHPSFTRCCLFAGLQRYPVLTGAAFAAVPCGICRSTPR